MIRVIHGTLTIVSVQTAGWEMVVTVHTINLVQTPIEAPIRKILGLVQKGPYRPCSMEDNMRLRERSCKIHGIKYR
jgi:hypothetical protein